tara:strand:+ start:1572 stop:2945 length:1374 start_codon:yes stop_codon:yes gene_type:complete
MQLNTSNPIETMTHNQIKKTPPKFKKIAPALAAASCSLLGITEAIAQENNGDWKFDVANLIYAESDSRVAATEPVFNATKTYVDGEILNVKLVFDSLTGASPNGATPSDTAQTFTRPSGNGEYTVDQDENPLDDTFRDSRGALSGNWTAPINRDWEYTLGAYGSKEFDYLSLGLNGGLKRYLNQKNTALNFGLALSADTIEPVGGKPLGLSRMAIPGSGTFDADFDASRADSSDNKSIIDALFGVTQVINANTIMQFNYGLSLSNGYLNDPYKILSVIDTTTGANYGGNYQNAGNNVYLYESRPDSRMKHTLYWQTKYALDNGDVIDGSYRFMIDDWGINSHTLDFRYRWDLGNSYLEPHLRYYMQSKADFYQRYLTSDEFTSGSIKEASSDERLSDMNAYTVGLKYGYKLSNDKEINVRAEYYMQTHSGDTGFGKLTSQDLYPDINAIIFQVGYSF